MEQSLPQWVIDAAALPVAFAQVREDAALDAGLVERLDSGARIIMAASGGCTAALLATLPNVEHLSLVDPNPSQLALTRLKMQLLVDTDSAERLALLGHAAMPAEDRADALLPRLNALGIPPELLGPIDLWAEIGPDHAGRYEFLFAQLRQELKAHAPAIEDLFRLDDIAEQGKRVNPETKLGKALDRAFDVVMDLPNLVRMFGEVATLDQVEPFGRHFARRTRHVLATLPAAANPYLGQVLLGRFPEGTTSPWLGADAPFRVPDISYARAAMNNAILADTSMFDLVILSNILDWLSPEEARTTLDLCREALKPGGWVFVRQFGSTLDIPSLSEGFTWETDTAREMHARDRSYFYRGLHLGRKL